MLLGFVLLVLKFLFHLLIYFMHKYIISLIFAFLICVVFAISDEHHQTFVAGRTGQPLDVVIDSAGAIAGLLFYSTYHITYKLGYRKGKELKDVE